MADGGLVTSPTCFNEAILFRGWKRGSSGTPLRWTSSFNEAILFRGWKQQGVAVGIVPAAVLQ